MSMAPWCNDAVHRWSEGRQQGETDNKNEDPACWGSWRLCLALFAFIPHPATHILQPTFVQIVHLPQRFYQKNPDHTSTPSLITALSYVHPTYRTIFLAGSCPCATGSAWLFFLPCSWYSSSNDRIISLSALLNSKSLVLAVAARATSVLPPVNLRSTVPKTTPTLAAGSPSLRAIPMW